MPYKVLQGKKLLPKNIVVYFYAKGKCCNKKLHFINKKTGVM